MQDLVHPGRVDWHIPAVDIAHQMRVPRSTCVSIMDFYPISTIPHKNLVALVKEKNVSMRIYSKVLLS